MNLAEMYDGYSSFRVGDHVRICDSEHILYTPSRDLCNVLCVSWKKASFRWWPRELEKALQVNTNTDVSGEVYSIRRTGRLSKIETVIALKVGGFYIVTLPEGLAKL